MATSTPLSAGSRLVVTSHAEDGTSIIASDEILAPFSPFGPHASSFAVFDTSATVPASNQGAAQDHGEALPRCPPAGVGFCVTAFPPRHRAPLHHTLSRDYAVVLEGEVVLALDGGAETTLRAGEFVVQGGVNHMWHNRSDQVCRVAFVMVGAEKVRLGDGTVLEETVLGKK
ncbi:hypothetical protein F4780DRAFT_782816 [Xylariomycetidae sp. FL0641]|nr:hypothetical protein F4780DRAFT_782816 [Xylariomycetidae sp. FL0641]